MLAYRKRGDVLNESCARSQGALLLRHACRVPVEDWAAIAGWTTLARRIALQGIRQDSDMHIWPAVSCQHCPRSSPRLAFRTSVDTGLARATTVNRRRAITSRGRVGERQPLFAAWTAYMHRSHYSSRSAYKKSSLVLVFVSTGRQFPRHGGPRQGRRSAQIYFSDEYSASVIPCLPSSHELFNHLCFAPDSVRAAVPRPFCASPTP